MTLDDELPSLIFLGSLSDSWETLVITINNSTLEGKLSMAHMKSNLINEEIKEQTSSKDKM